MTRHVNNALELLADAILERSRRRSDGPDSEPPIDGGRPANTKKRRGRVTKLARKLIVRTALATTVSILIGALPALAAEGDIDEDFATEGAYVVDANPNVSDLVRTVQVGPQGRVYGALLSEPGRVVALDLNGTLDTSYGNAGFAMIHPNWPVEPQASALDSKENLVLAGVGENPQTSKFVPWISRLDSSGAVDQSIGNEGQLFVGDTEGSFHSVWLDSGGRIVAVGNRGTEIFAARFRPDGQPDAGFGEDGMVVITGVSNGRPVHGAPAGDGAIVVTGTTPASGSNGTDIFVMRILANGTHDQEFGTVTVDVRPSDRPAGLAITKTGRIVIVGFSEEGKRVVSMMTRLLPDGSLDLSLQGSGTASFDKIGSSPSTLDVALDAIGRIVIVGNTFDGGPGVVGFVARLRFNGSLDPGFGSGGFTLVEPPSPSSLYSAAIQSDGKIAAGGSANGAPMGAATDSLVARFEASTPDPSFIDDDDSVFENAIEKLAQHQITLGCNPPDNTRFCPDDRITRGQMAAFLVRAIGYTDDGGGDHFTDTTGHTFELAIDRLRTAGVTQGCNPPDNDQFCPDDLVTRGQMAAFLVRALGYSDDGGGDLFTDDDDSIFERAIDRLGTARVTQGCNPPDNDQFCPNNPVTRGQMAAFLARALGLP